MDYLKDEIQKKDLHIRLQFAFRNKTDGTLTLIALFAFIYEIIFALKTFSGESIPPEFGSLAIVLLFFLFVTIAKAQFFDIYKKEQADLSEFKKSMSIFIDRVSIDWLLKDLDLYMRRSGNKDWLSAMFYNVDQSSFDRLEDAEDKYIELYSGYEIVISHIVETLDGASDRYYTMSSVLRWYLGKLKLVCALNRLGFPLNFVKENSPIYVILKDLNAFDPDNVKILHMIGDELFSIDISNPVREFNSLEELLLVTLKNILVEKNSKLIKKFVNLLKKYLKVDSVGEVRTRNDLASGMEYVEDPDSLFLSSTTVDEASANSD